MLRRAKSASSAENRRTFLKTGAVAAAAVAGQTSARAANQQKLALFGGAKAVTRSSTAAAHWPLYGAEEEQAVLKLVKSPSYEPLTQLEKAWKQYYKIPYCKAQCNGTAALSAMFFALNLPAGSEIMVPSYTFFATIVPMRLFGLVPVFVDIDPRTLNFDLEDAKRRLTKNTRAVLPVHWIGLPAEMDHICDWAKQKGLIVMEDSCHAHGARLKGRLMGTWGEMAAFSFQGSKPLPALEGGMANYQNREYYERGTAYGHYDAPVGFGADSAYSKYYGSGLGVKTRMHPMAGALACCQLKGLEARNAAGTAQIRRLNDRLIHLPGLYEQRCRPDAQRLYYGINMLFIDEKKAGMTRAACVKALQAEGVSAGASSYRLQHKLPLYADPQWWHHKPTIPNLPNSDLANATAISLPYFTSDQPELVEQYAAAFEKVWAHRAELK